MKKNLLPLCIFFFSCSCFAQTSYIPFPEDSAQWSVWHYFNQGNSIESFQYKMKGDTVLNGITYSKVYKSQVLYYGANDTDLHCFIRQDTALKLVYIKYPYQLYQDSSEFVLYDFNMQTGDTISIKLIADGSIHHLRVDLTNMGATGYGPTPFYSLYPIDSCMGVQGCLWGTACDNIGILQGIGQGNNFLYPEMPPMHCYMWGDNSYNLQCFWYKGQYIFGGTFCDYSTSIKESENHFQISITPNPFTELINIKVNDNHTSEFVLYDIASRKLLELTFVKSTTINTNQFAKGIYLYEVRNENGVIKNGKVVKE